MFFGYQNIQKSRTGQNSIVVRVVQPATAQAEKIAWSRADALNRALERIDDLTKLAGDVRDVDLVLYPETVYPFTVRHDDVMPVATNLQKPVAIGATVHNDGLVYNSLVVADENGKITNIYSKSHLVPFGEYGPIKFIPAPANLTAGRGPRVISGRFGGDNKSFSFAPAVCYEIIFSGAVVGTEPVDAIINITNDTWFGKTPGTYQHLDMVRRAAIESGVPVVRANYSGISAFVGADGKIISSLPIGNIGFLDGSVHGSHMTLYRMLGRDAWFIIVLLIACIAGFIAHKADKNN